MSKLNGFGTHCPPRAVIILAMFVTVVRPQGGGQTNTNLFPLANVTTADVTGTGEFAAPGNVVQQNQQNQQPRDCAEIQDAISRNSASSGSSGLGAPRAASGVYTIWPSTCPGCYYNVYCDMVTEGGGWTIIMRRFNGTEDFYRGWWFYKFGFGNIASDFYLGNERVHQLTHQKPMELRVCLTDVGMVDTVAGYSHFQLSNESENYHLHVDSYYGDAGDYLYKSNGRPFSTFDRDNDGTLRNCAEYFHSAWWYHSYGECHTASNLFGYYFLGKQELPHFAGPGFSWKPVPGVGGPAVKGVIMKIRPMGYLGAGFVLNSGAGGGSSSAGGSGGNPR